MQYRKVGRSGLSTSILGLGCVNFGAGVEAAEAKTVVAAAMELGVNLFDTGDNYNEGSSEEMLGAALGKRRQDVIISTKFTGGNKRFCADGSRNNIIKSCEDSLKRLGTDYIDLYTIHHPDPETPIEETLDTLDDLIKQGKVRYTGSSNFASWQLAEADHVAKERVKERFVAAQMEWSLLKRYVENEIVPACQHYDIGIMPFYPIASGLLTGKYKKGHQFPEGTRLADNQFYATVATEQNFSKLDRLTDYAESQGHSILDLAMSWLACQRGVCCVLTGVSSAEQLQKNAQALTWELNQDNITDIEKILKDDMAFGDIPFIKLKTYF